MIDYLSVEISWQKEKPTSTGAYLCRKRGQFSSSSFVCDISYFEERFYALPSGRAKWVPLESFIDCEWLSIPE